MRLFILLSVLTAYAWAAAIDNKKEVTPLKAVIESTVQFSTHFYKTLAKKQSGNFISSSLSANAILSMTCFGAKGNTRKLMNNVLRMPADETIAKSGIQNLIDKLNSMEQVKLANKIFPNINLVVNKEFIDLTKNNFRSEEQQLNFTNNQESAKTINSWFEANTNGKIKDIFKPDDLSADTAMVLVNAVYFKGQWKNQFNSTETTNRIFHVDNKTVKKVPTMFQNERILYGDLPEMNARFVEIPYKADNMSMIIVLPNEKDGIQEVEEKLDHVNLKFLRESGYFTEVKLHLPRFKIESSFNLKDALTEMGMGEIFTSQANFRNIADANLKVSEVIQKVFIEVNEEGSDAAAGIGTRVVFFMMPPPPPTFDANRPFLYYIVYDTNKNNYSINERVVLFSGRVTDPEEKNSDAFGQDIA